MPDVRPDALPALLALALVCYGHEAVMNAVPQDVWDWLHASDISRPALVKTVRDESGEGETVTTAQGRSVLRRALADPSVVPASRLAEAEREAREAAREAKAWTEHVGQSWRAEYEDLEAAARELADAADDMRGSTLNPPTISRRTARDRLLDATEAVRALTDPKENT